MEDSLHKDVCLKMTNFSNFLVDIFEKNFDPEKDYDKQLLAIMTNSFKNTPIQHCCVFGSALLEDKKKIEKLIETPINDEWITEFLNILAGISSKLIFLQGDTGYIKMFLKSEKIEEEQKKKFLNYFIYFIEITSYLYQIKEDIKQKNL